MGTKDRASIKAQGAKGRVKEAAGALTGNRDLKKEGRADQTKSRNQDAKQDLIEAAHKVKDAVTR